TRTRHLQPRRRSGARSRRPRTAARARTVAAQGRAKRRRQRRARTGRRRRATAALNGKEAMKPALKFAALALALCLPFHAEAHRVWMLPSATVLSGNEAWVTVDGAVSNDLFYFEHVPLR